MKRFNKGVLDIDAEQTVASINQAIQHQIQTVLKKRGTVVAISGGIDSSVTAALSVNALGNSRVLTLALPEVDSNPESTRLARLLAAHLGTELIVENIAGVLEAFGCYRHRDEAVKRIFPEYTSDYKLKIVLPQNLLDTNRINFFYLTVEDPSGRQETKRLPVKELLEIVAATNHKQRTRTQFAYYHADRLEYAVCGTPNRLEYDQGFFVKGGDGLADLKPIAHLYKSQVYALARHLGLPEDICTQRPTTDTYSLGQTQEEFYFALPYDKLDLVLWALNHNVPAAETAEVMGYTEEQVNRVYADIIQKRRRTEYLHLKPLLVEPVPEIKTSFS
jgi:NAD+ synthase